MDQDRHAHRRVHGPGEEVDAPPDTSANLDGPDELERLRALRPALEARARIIEAVRAFFRERGFLELETPARVPNPGLEPHLVPFPAGTAPDGSPRWLITSPELHLKRFLAAGYEKIFEVARTFRDDEVGHLHAPEFALLEWYRARAELDALAADLAELLPACARAAGREPRTAVEGCDLTAEAETLTYHAAFLLHAGRDPRELSVDERERAFVSDVELRLGRGRPTLLVEYPADAAALARIVPSSDVQGMDVAARMELYVAGVELANGFDELTDAAEQRRRHEADREARRASGAVVPPLDEGFLRALERGLPPSAGMALGLDRLVLLLLDEGSIADVSALTEGPKA